MRLTRAPRSLARALAPGIGSVRIDATSGSGSVGRVAGGGAFGGSVYRAGMKPVEVWLTWRWCLGWP